MAKTLIARISPKPPGIQGNEGIFHNFNNIRDSNIGVLGVPGNVHRQ